MGRRFGQSGPRRAVLACYGRWVNKERLKLLLAQYGRAAMATYLGLFILVLSVFAILFRFGFESAHWGSADTLSKAGVFGAAYLATKLTQPLRILATVALTPLMARIFGRKAESGVSPS